MYLYSKYGQQYIYTCTCTYIPYMVNNIFIYVHVLIFQIWSTIYLYMYMYLHSKYGQQYIYTCTCTYIPNMVNNTLIYVHVPIFQIWSTVHVQKSLKIWYYART